MCVIESRERSNETPQPQAPGVRGRFTLRMLMLFVACIAGIMGWRELCKQRTVREWQAEQHVIATIRQLGGTVATKKLDGLTRLTLLPGEQQFLERVNVVSLPATQESFVDYRSNVLTVLRRFPSIEYVIVSDTSTRKSKSTTKYLDIDDLSHELPGVHVICVIY